MHLYREALAAYALERDLNGEEKADESAESWAMEHYEEMKNAILGLLPWAGAIDASTSGPYDILEFQGRKTTRLHLCKSQLEQFRAHGAQEQAWEALCAVFAAISSRREKVWLEEFVMTPFLDEVLETLSGCKSKHSVKRKAAIREFVTTFVENGAGAFARTLIDPNILHRVTFARGPTGPLPATSMTTRRIPLWDALQAMDDRGPLRGEAADKRWCWGADRQFALQDLQYGQDEANKLRMDKGLYTSRNERMHVKDLKPDPKLRELLHSKKPVVYLDTLASLAPRRVCKSQGLSEIVTMELATLFREAKARGEAVVFSMGSTNPHKLAEKVYLRAPLADYGMRCGCLRWRASSEVPWAREVMWDDRHTLCLQMP
jgi:hypothetical protein